MNNKITLLSPDETISDSSVVIGSVILEALKKKDKMPIFDIYPLVRKKSGSFNYENTISAIFFLYMNNIIDFDPPFIYNLALVNKIK